MISVGSISAGGAGKTPFLIALAGLLREMGYAPDVLSRGYGRKSRAVLRVDAQGSGERFGDEPLLLAQVLGCPVFVAAERFTAGTLAELEVAGNGRNVHLLDDGFSHRRLARTIDIVLLTSADARDIPLPAGNLREPLTALRRADVIVLRASEAAALRTVVERVLQPTPERILKPSTGPQHGKPVWTITRHLTLPAATPARPLVFSGIARPADFEEALRERCVQSAGMRIFRDHHRYRDADATLLVRKAADLRADGFVTTSKDAVKLSSAMLKTLGQLGPLAVADVRVDLHDRDRCARDLQALLESR